MKPPAGHEKARRPASRRQQVRLDLRPTKRRPSPEEEIEEGQKSSFWMWFSLVALFHILVIVGLAVFFRARMTPPPEPFISLLPEGETVKGTAGEQAAPKVGATTPAPSTVHHHHVTPAPPQPQPEASTPPPPRPEPELQPPPPILHPDLLSPGPVHVAQVKPKPKPKPIKPKPVKPKPKVKVDLHLEDGPNAETTTTPAPEKPKPKRIKKAAPQEVLGDDSEIDREISDPANRGLSRAEIAAKIGDKLDAEGVAHADKSGASGVAGAHTSPFEDFYNSIREQITDKWQVPNQDDAQATNPVVQIHVESDGRVPPERVTLLHSSGNQAIDDSALAAARTMGYTLQPLPDGCPPDISITLQLNH
jgi:TonB family protein